MKYSKKHRKKYNDIIIGLYFTFQKLVRIVGPKIQKNKINMGMPISSKGGLAVTLRFLATGESYDNFMYQFRILKSTIAKFIPKICGEIYNSLRKVYLRLPGTKEEWMIYEQETLRNWQFPNCIGTAHEKHIPILHPADSRAEFFNYKGFF